jgi:hypothetical protein
VFARVINGGLAGTITGLDMLRPVLLTFSQCYYFV